MEMRIKYDLHYIRNWSLWFDFKIVLFTVFRGFLGKNVYEAFSPYSDDRDIFDSLKNVLASFRFENNTA
jgi:hypothetical protein